MLLAAGVPDESTTNSPSIQSEPSFGRRAPVGSETPSESQMPLTDDLVRQVADKVYAMLMRDVAIEMERQGLSRQVTGVGGGW